MIHQTRKQETTQQQCITLPHTFTMSPSNQKTGWKTFSDGLGAVKRRKSLLSPSSVVACHIFMLLGSVSVWNRMDPPSTVYGKHLQWKQVTHSLRKPSVWGLIICSALPSVNNSVPSWLLNMEYIFHGQCSTRKWLPWRQHFEYRTTKIGPKHWSSYVRKSWPFLPTFIVPCVN